MHAADMMGESLDRDESWDDLVALLEKRYAPTLQRVAEGNRNGHPLESHPAIAGSIDKITCLPTNDDYPLWRIRCKVFFISIFVRYTDTFISSWASKKR